MLGCATCGRELTTTIAPAAVGVGESVAFSVTVAPRCTATGLGSRSIGLIGTGVPSTRTSTITPARAATLSVSVCVARSSTRLAADGEAAKQVGGAEDLDAVDRDLERADALAVLRVARGDDQIKRRAEAGRDAEAARRLLGGAAALLGVREVDERGARQALRSRGHGRQQSEPAQCDQDPAQPRQSPRGQRTNG